MKFLKWLVWGWWHRPHFPDPYHLYQIEQQKRMAAQQQHMTNTERLLRSGRYGISDRGGQETYTPYRRADLPARRRQYEDTGDDGSGFVTGLILGSMLSGAHHESSSPDPTPPSFSGGGGESGGGGASASWDSGSSSSSDSGATSINDS